MACHPVTGRHQVTAGRHRIAVAVDTGVDLPEGAGAEADPLDAGLLPDILLDDTGLDHGLLLTVADTPPDTVLLILHAVPAVAVPRPAETI